MRNRPSLMFNLFLLALSSFVFCFASSLKAQTPTPSPSLDNRPAEVKAFDNLNWRSIGPANMSGRVADVEGVPGNPNIVYVGSASGGVWKTTNGGNSWTPIFERQGTQSIGDIALEPNNPDVVWVGTGESNARNSVSFGDGVYKSTDGGKTWKHVGLRETNSISRIIINPRNPDIVYVAAVGRLWGPNEERGVFMTTDGGKTWAKTLYIDKNHGASDLEIDPQNPNILYAGMWLFERKPWTHTSGSDKGGVFRSTDGGRTWNKVTNGLPKMIGRIGLAVSQSNPNVVYAITEAKEGALYRSDNKGETFQMTYQRNNIVSRGFYYTTVRVDPSNENKVFAVSSPLFVSIDGGRNFRTIAPRIHIDYHAFWIDPQNPKRIWLGNDGGIAVSNDGGDSWENVNNFPLGQFYQIFADNSQPFYNISGGLQDNGTWTGPSRTRDMAGILNDHWKMVSFGDGFFAIAHPDNPNLFLTESQGGAVVRTNLSNGEQQTVIPYYAPGGAAENNKFRFNWNSPLIPSPHDKNTVYLAGNAVFKSTDFGLSWTQISQDLTTNNKERLKDAGGPIFPENTSAEYFCTIISLAESPIQAGQIWAGTDDGNLQVTTDSGKNWTNVNKNVPNVSADSSVSHVEPSRVNANTVYVAYDRHKFDDYKPYVFKSTDGGKSFTNITGNLPANAYVHVVREDPKNPNLIYAGTEIGLFASYDGGKNWITLGLKNFPNVAVHDIIVHPRDNDLILGTHGRSIWVFDDATPIQQMSESVLKSDAQLFDVRPALRFSMMFARYGIGDRLFTAANPPNGALIYYYLKDKPDEKTAVKMQILDANGKMVVEMKNVPKERGVNRAVWNLSHEGSRQRRPLTEQQLMFFGPPQGPRVLPGVYTVKLFVGDKTFEKKVEVRLDPTVNVQAADLQTQLDMLLKLRDMQSSLNDALRFLDSVKTQTTQIETTIKERLNEVPADVKKALDDYKKKAKEISDAIAADDDDDGLRAAGKLVDMVGGLYFSVGRVNAAPTQTQKAFFSELQTEFQQKMPAVIKFINEETQKLNDALRKINAPTFMVGKGIEMGQ
jgi:photosystem II stability/assembly factor-like uncharacterized protein